MKTGKEIEVKQATSNDRRYPNVFLLKIGGVQKVKCAILDKDTKGESGNCPLILRSMEISSKLVEDEITGRERRVYFLDKIAADNCDGCDHCQVVIRRKLMAER